MNKHSILPSSCLTTSAIRKSISQTSFGNGIQSIIFHKVQLNLKFNLLISGTHTGFFFTGVRYNSSGNWVNRQKTDFYTQQAKSLKLRSRAAFKLLEIDEKFKLFKKDKPQNIIDLGFAPGAWSQVAKSRSHPDSVVLGVDILPCKPPKGVNAIQANILSKKTHTLIRFFFSNQVTLNKHDDLHEDYGYFEKYQEEINLEKNLEDSEEKSSMKNEKSNFIEKQPVDLIISDMYVPFPQIDGFWSNTTNLPYYRLANTSGVAIKDHYASIDLCDAALIAACDLLRPGGNFICKFYTGKEDNLLEKRFRKTFTKVYRFKPQACRDESKETYMIGVNKRQNVDKVNVFS